MAYFNALFMQYTRFLDRQGTLFNLLAGVSCAALVGIFDHIAPDEVIASFLYLFPISFVAWFAGRTPGVLIAVSCAAIWAYDNLKSSSLLILAWNAFSVAGIFLVVSLLVAKIRQMLEMERELSTRDPLTGVMNMRAFSEVVEYEILRHKRQLETFSFAFLDLDNFKQVNDRYGHLKGDELLRSVVDCLVDNLRKTDIVARAGGDEFIIFFPMTGQDAVQVVMEKVRERLAGLSLKIDCPTSVSTGVLTCTHGLCDLDEIIFAADKLMYEVKATGKNNVRFAEYGNGGDAVP
ncbi:MAG: diguanylate cyclase [Oryzomonas sp.]|jgi:diguanylate cyclase (GGDEF)-like protein